jgi:uncharacterized protein
MKTFMALWLTLSLPALAFSPPDFKGNVLDEAGVLSESDKTDLHRSIQAARDNGGIWAAVYILPTLNGASIEDAAEATFRHWKLGEEGKDNGLLFLVAVSDRKMRIETGYGLEGSLPDLITARVIEQDLKPHFRNNQFAAGISEGLGRLVKHHLRQETITAEKAVKLNPVAALFCFLFNFSIAGLFWLLYFRRKSIGRVYTVGWFDNELLYGHAVALLLFCVFSIFWMSTDPESLLTIIVPVNVVFLLAGCGPLFYRPLQLVLSEKAYSEWAKHWLKYDEAYKAGHAGFTKALRDEKLLDYVEMHPLPRKPLFHFGKQWDMQDPSTFRVPGSSNGGIRFSSSSHRPSSSRSSSFRSSSSSGGGRSGGGGASGSW